MQKTHYQYVRQPSKWAIRKAQHLYNSIISAPWASLPAFSNNANLKAWICDSTGFAIAINNNNSIAIGNAQSTTKETTKVKPNQLKSTKSSALHSS